jgi:uncharacterized protein (DUF488 family)
MNPILLFTIGFAGKSAEQFFETLRKAGVRRLVDIRLNNVSQLAGFTKKRDLQYFLRTIAGIEYAHLPDLAPTKEILDVYKNKHIDWSEYEARFGQLLRSRQPDGQLLREEFDRACLLCSEPTPERCHRWLARFALRQRGPEYCLAVTDPEATWRLNGGDRSAADCLLTVSLTQPIRLGPPDAPELCYKLVAAVIELGG